MLLLMLNDTSKSNPFCFRLEAAMQRLTNLCSVLNDMEPICVLNHVFVLREVRHVLAPSVLSCLWHHNSACLFYMLEIAVLPHRLACASYLFHVSNLEIVSNQLLDV